MKYSLVDSKDPILSQKLEDFDFTNPPTDPVELVENLHKILREKGGLALSANQVGLPYRVFVINTQDDKPLAFFNCKIVDYSDETEVMEEGCLSYPGLFIKIKRPKSVRARITNEHNVTEAHRFDGLTSRIIQHEYDHLEGLNFISRATRFHLTKAKKDHKLLLRRKLKKGL
jgi:peptide deformylase